MTASILAKFSAGCPMALMEHAVYTNRLPGFAELQHCLSLFGPYDLHTRLIYGSTFGYGVPCKETVAAISAFPRVLELGAGNGYWSYWLRRAGCDVIATDPDGRSSAWIPDIARLDAEGALRTFQGRTLLIVWPHFTAGWPASVVRHLGPGTVLCYVGEGPYGCCAPVQFFDELVRSSFRLIYHHRSPSWPPTVDYLGIYRRH
jgi:hypothetical protein